jgi:2-hydroxychromene-2-carboxylate isomerase
MPAPIEFYFDFTSPYAYLASTQIEALAGRFGRTVAYRPVLLGAIFKTTGGVPLVDAPLKGDYSRRDMERSARYLGVPFRMPSTFPVGTVNAARALLWLQAQGSGKSVSWVHRVFRAYFAEDRNISDAAVLGELAAELGIDPAALAAGTQEPAIKDKLKTLNEQALARGVFGAPYIVVDGEPFWGADRLPQIARWLERGPF